MDGPSPLRFDLGRLSVEVEGAGELRDTVVTELLPVRRPGRRDGSARIVLRFSVPAGPAGDAVGCGPVTVDGAGLLVSRLGLLYHVTEKEDHRLITITSANPGGAPRWLQRLGDWGYLDRAGRTAKNVFYDVLDPWGQVDQLRVGQSWLHAAVVERDGVACALAGWGGAGKTSAALDLVQRGWRLLADDLAPVDDGETAWRNPKWLQVYGYNVRGEPDRQRQLLRGAGLLDRAAWHVRLGVLGPRGVRRRRSAEAFLGPDAVARRGQLRHVFFLRRTPQLRARAAAPEDVAKSAAACLLEELNPIVELSAAAQCAGGAHLLPSPEELVASSTRVLCAAFADAACWWLDVPPETPPRKVADAIQERVNG